MFSDFSLDGGHTANLDALLEQSAFATALARNRQDYANSILRACEGADLLHWSYDLNSAYPCSAAFKQGNILYIHVGGTQPVVAGNLRNASGALNTMNVTGAQLQTNAWFNQVASVVLDRLQADLPAGWLGWHRQFVGFSQGAAVALLLGVRLQDFAPAGPWDILQLAGPRAFAGPTVPNLLQPRFSFVVVNGDDPVPRVPPPGAIYALRASPLSFITWGTSVGWYHLGRILLIGAQGATNTIDPGPAEPPLTAAMLATVDSWHESSLYSNIIKLVWRIANG